MAAKKKQTTWGFLKALGKMAVTGDASEVEETLSDIKEGIQNGEAQEGAKVVETQGEEVPSSRRD
jgi:hypothetical protein